MTVPMCGAITFVPLPELREVLEAHGETLSDKDRDTHCAPVRCELATGHELDGTHCVQVKEWDDASGNLWWRWLTNGAGRFESALACEAASQDADPQACYLIITHPAKHSWEIRNPE